jgi:hypothetical protein
VAGAPAADGSRSRLRTALGPLALLVGLAFAVGLVLALAYLLRTLGDLVADTYRTSTYIGINPPKALAFAALGLILLVALPLAIADGVSSARFRRAERDLRDARPHAAVARYEGPEGRGLLFDAPEGRTLLLRPAGGLGRPRVVPLPADAAPAEAPGGG